MKNILKYICSMLVGSIGIAFFVWIGVIGFCGMLSKGGIPSIQECFLIYVLIYIVTVVFVIFEGRPYDEWINENK